MFKSQLFVHQGHAAPVLYAAWVEAGLIPESELLNLRKIDNDLEGHPTPVSVSLEQPPAVCPLSHFSCYL